MVRPTNGNYSGVSAFASALSLGLGSVDFKRIYSGLLMPFKAIKALFSGDANPKSISLAKRASVEAPPASTRSSSPLVTREAPPVTREAAFNMQLKNRMRSARNAVAAGNMVPGFGKSCTHSYGVSVAESVVPKSKSGAVFIGYSVRDGKGEYTQRLPERNSTLEGVRLAPKIETTSSHHEEPNREVHEKLLSRLDGELNVVAQTLLSAPLEAMLSLPNGSRVTNRGLNIRSEYDVELQVNVLNSSGERDLITVGLEKVGNSVTGYDWRVTQITSFRNSLSRTDSLSPSN